MEPNPYQSPQADEPLKPAQVVKRGLGLVAILLLTPVAVGIAGFVSCHAAFGYASLAAEYPSFPILGMAVVAFGPPVAVLYYMIKWAIATHRRNKFVGRPDESPQPKPQKSLLERLVQFPTLSSLALLILTVSIISALIFTWLAYSLHGPNR